MRCGEIQIGGNRFRKILYFLGKALFFYENHSISAKNVNFYEFCENDASFQQGGVIFCEFCEKDARFQKGGGVIFANSAKKTHVSQG